MSDFFADIIGESLFDVVRSGGRRRKQQRRKHDAWLAGLPSVDCALRLLHGAGASIAREWTIGSAALAPGVLYYAGLTRPPRPGEPRARHEVRHVIRVVEVVSQPHHASGRADGLVVPAGWLIARLEMRTGAAEWALPPSRFDDSVRAVRP